MPNRRNNVLSMMLNGVPSVNTGSDYSKEVKTIGTSYIRTFRVNLISLHHIHARIDFCQICLMRRTKRILTCVVLKVERTN